MNTIIECPYCRKPISIVRKIATGNEVLEDVYCTHCKRSMDIEFDDTSNLPYLLAYFGKAIFPSTFTDTMLYAFEYDILHMTGIRIKKSEDQKKHRAYKIRYHEDSIDALINIWYKEKSVKCVSCAKCGRSIHLNQKKDAKDVYGLFCNQCARISKFRCSYDFLSEFYDAEQALLKEETENQVDQESKSQEEKRMAIKSTIIGFVLEDGGMYKIYNPETNQLANLTAADFDSLCLGEFPYRKVRANTLANNEIVETLDGKTYYVSDASKNEMFDFETGKIERSAVVTNLMVNTNCYVKYVPVLKKYCTFADVAAGNVDPRIAKMIEVISNDIQSGKETTENNVVAKMVRFLVDPNYADLLDTETLNDMVMADPQAFMVMSQMTNMQMAKSIMSHGSIPLSVQTQMATPSETVSDDCMRLTGEEDSQFKARLTKLMEEAANNGDYETAAKYQKALKAVK